MSTGISKSGRLHERRESPPPPTIGGLLADLRFDDEDIAEAKKQVFSRMR